MFKTGLCHDATLQQMLKAALSAKLIIMWIDNEGGTRTQSLFAYRRIVSGLAGIDDADGDDLVSNESFLSTSTIPSITYNESNVITAFTR